MQRGSKGSERQLIRSCVHRYPHNVFSPVSEERGKACESRRWAPAGIRPIVGRRIVREYTYAFAAVSPHDGVLDSLVLPNGDAETMSFFLTEVARRSLPNSSSCCLTAPAGTQPTMSSSPKTCALPHSRRIALSSTQPNTSGISPPRAILRQPGLRHDGRCRRPARDRPRRLGSRPTSRPTHNRLPLDHTDTFEGNVES